MNNGAAELFAAMTDIVAALRAIHDCDAISFTTSERRAISTAIREKLMPRMVEGVIVESFSEYLIRATLVAQQNYDELERPSAPHRENRHD